MEVSMHFRFSEELNRKCVFFLNPQSLRDSPGGARGKDSPKPLRSLRASHGLFNPQSLRDSPGGARGKDSPKPLRSLRSEW